MPLNLEQTTQWTNHLRTVLLTADTTHNPYEKLNIILQGCEMFHEHMQMLAVAGNDLPPEIINFLNRLDGRVSASRLIFTKLRLSAEIRTQISELIVVYLPTGSNSSCLSKENELIDDLAQIIKQAAADAFVAKRSSKFQIFSSTDEDSKRALIGLNKTSSRSGQWFYELSCPELEIYQDYAPLINAMNGYGEIKELRDINNPAEIEKVDDFIANCTQLLNDQRYTSIAEKFHTKLSELKAFVLAEQAAHAIQTAEVAYEPPQP